MMIQLCTAFGAGLLATLSPCVYPLLPVTLGYFGTLQDSKAKFRLGLFILGQWLALSVLGVCALTLGNALGFSSEMPAVKISIALLLIIFGLAALFNLMPRFLNSVNQRVRFKNSSAFPNLSALLFGVSSALLFSPCVTPLLGGVLALAAYQDSIAFSIALMSLYSLGFSTVILLIGLGFMSLKELPKSGIWLKYLHSVASLVLIGWGLYLLMQVLASNS